MPIAATARPMASGARLEPTAVLRVSMRATTKISRNAVPTIWSISGPAYPPWKYGAGNVAKIENVARACPPPRGVLADVLNALIALVYTSRTRAAPTNAPQTCAAM
jgi:hypothetical protein